MPKCGPSSDSTTPETKTTNHKDPIFLSELKNIVSQTSGMPETTSRQQFPPTKENPYLVPVSGSTEQTPRALRTRLRPAQKPPIKPKPNLNMAQKVYGSFVCTSSKKGNFV